MTSYGITTTREDESSQLGEPWEKGEGCHLNMYTQRRATLLFLCDKLKADMVFCCQSIFMRRGCTFVVSFAELGAFIIRRILYLIGCCTYLFVPGGFA